MKRIAAAVLICLCLSACGGEETPTGGLLGQASGLNESAVLLTVDGRQVPAWRYLCWLAYTCDRVAERCREAGTALDWGAPLSGGTLADYAKNQALESTVLYATVENWAERYGVTADPSGWARIVDAYGGEAACLARCARLGLDQTRAKELADTGALYSQLCALCAVGEGPFAPETMAAFAAQQGCVTVERLLYAFGDDRESARQRAAEAFARLNGAADQGAVFSDLAQSDDDPAGARTLLPGDDALPPALEDAARELDIGQCSGILESDEGFSILRRLETDVSGLTEPYLDALLEKAADSAAVETTEGYDALDTAAFYAALTARRAES